MEYKKHGVAGVEGGPEGQRTQVTKVSVYNLPVDKKIYYLHLFYFANKTTVI